MTDKTPFPPKPGPSVARDEVIEYLLEHQRRGYQVFQLTNGNLELTLDETRCIRFVGIANGEAQVQAFAMNNIFGCYDCTNLAEVRRAVDAIAHNFIGKAWQQSPSTGRLTEDSPASNLNTISRLVGTSSIEAIFDPYLENRSLAAVIDILSFGSGTVADNVRVLSTAKTAGREAPRLTQTGFDAWLTQLGVAGEIRIMAPTEHRRFILLSSGESLLLGPSLNSLHKNEAVRLEPGAQDKTFFEQVWAKATPLT